MKKIFIAVTVIFALQINGYSQGGGSEKSPEMTTIFDQQTTTTQQTTSFDQPATDSKGYDGSNNRQEPGRKVSDTPIDSQTVILMFGGLLLAGFTLYNQKRKQGA